MERIEEGQPFNVLVDYAHTDDALRNALGMLRASPRPAAGRLRLRRQSAPTAAADDARVQERADFAWATADNPRSEPLARIFADMKGASHHGTIASSTTAAGRSPGARRGAARGLPAHRGQGHESYQEFVDTIIPFDDRRWSGSSSA